MTLEKDKKHSLFFWKKHHGHTTAPLENTVSPVEAGNSPEVAFEPDKVGSEYAEKDVNFSALFMPFVKNYLANISQKKSPTKLPYPPCFYYPASSLQHQMQLQMQYIDLLIKANTLPTPLERFLGVLKYHISTCSLTKFPYKPIIAFVGETAQTFTKHTDGISTDTTYYIGEQVEREPPASAFYIANPTHGVIHEGNVTMIPKFKQAHVHVGFVGHRKTILTHPQGLYRESYVGDVPALVIRILRMHTELGGSIGLSCEETGYAATITFKDKPIFGGLRNGVSGRVTLHGREIYQMDGAWDDVVFLIDPITKEKFELFNRNSYQKLKVESYPIEQQPATSGERVWGELISTILRKDFEQAKVVKAQLDAEAQVRIAGFDQNPFATSFFNKTLAGTWTIKDPSLIYSGAGAPTM